MPLAIKPVNSVGKSAKTCSAAALLLKPAKMLDPVPVIRAGA